MIKDALKKTALTTVLPVVRAKAILDLIIRI